MAMTAPSRALGPVIDPDTLHSYLVVQKVETWPDAVEAAEALSDAGSVCHLATITSLEESQFIEENLALPDGELWIGGERRSKCPGSEDSEAFWGKWVTGEFWGFTDWAADAPDECDDDCLVLIVGEEGDDEVLQGQGGAAQAASETAWDEDACDEAFPYLVECKTRIGAPVVSRGALVVLSMLMIAASWWTLRRRRARLAS